MLRFSSRNKALFTALFFLFTSSAVFAQTAISVLTVKIPEALDLSVSSGSIVDFDFTSSIASLSSGIEKQNAVILTYKSNKPWFINISAGSTNFSGGDGTMPCSVVEFKNNSGGTYTPLSITPVSLSGTASSKNSRGSSTIGVDYKLKPGLDYSPATDYSISITYTASTI